MDQSGATDGYDYVRQHYGVEVEIGQRVVIDGTPGLILRGQDDQYLYFTTNGKNSLRAHPTWRVDYRPGASWSQLTSWGQSER
jgi:hypothetical protein